MSRLPVAGETFGRYQLLQKLGQGGMGVVYAAHDTVLNRKVALKLVAPHLAEDPEFRVRFAREAETQARLDSSHVVRIYDYGELDGLLYLSTQLIEGSDLASLVATNGALTPALAVRVVAQVLDGLEAAHEADVVHRDVKPANVLVRQQGSTVAAYLCDFGIATTAGNDVTRTGQVIGSLPWMAPERHYGHNPGAVGDVYSAGCLLFYVLTGAAPYAGSDGEVMMGHLEGPVPQLAGRTPFIRKVNGVLVKALAKDPQRRYASAGAMAADVLGLAPLAQGEAVLPGTTVIRPVARAATTTRRPATRPMRRRRAPWLAPVVITLLSLLAAVGGGLGVRVLAGEPELAAGAVETTVGGRTVVLQPKVTLSPVASASAGASAPASAAVVPGDASVHVAGGAPVRAGGAPTGAASPAPNPNVAAPAPAAPRYAYRCWDSASHLTNDLASCGVPSGTTGARWVYGGYGDGCYVINAGDARVQQAYQCWVGDVHLNLYRFASASDARGFLDGFLITGAVWSEWSTAGSWAGYRRAGEAAGQDRPYRHVFYYSPSGVVWGAVVAAQTASARGSVVTDTVQKQFRSLPTMRGERL